MYHHNYIHWNAYRHRGEQGLLSTELCGCPTVPVGSRSGRDGTPLVGSVIRRVRGLFLFPFCAHSRSRSRSRDPRPASQAFVTRFNPVAVPQDELRR